LPFRGIYLCQRMKGLRIDPDDLSPEHRMDALARVLAEGIVALAESGQLNSLLAEPPASVRRFGKPLDSGPKTVYRSP
jgi:hypothetical protein